MTSSPRTGGRGSGRAQGPIAVAARWVMTGYRRQRVAALEICSTSVAFILLRHVGLLADLPVLTYLGLFAVAGFIGSVATAKFPSGSERDLFLRFATHIGAATTVMYATGWGPALAVGFVYVGCEEIEHTGSKAAGPVLVMTVAGIGAGQVAIAAGMAPSILPYPEVHGLAVLAALGVAFAVRVAASAAAKREEVQADLREREARFRNLVQNISDLVIVIDEAGLLSYASPAAERMLGYDAVSMLGTNVFDIVHPDDRDRVVEIFLETLEEGPGVKGLLDLRVAHTDGRWVHVEVIGNIVVSDGVLEGYVITVRDVTERAEASEALRVSEERYRVLLNALNEGVAVVCRDGTMLACNDIGQEMLGLGPAGVTEFQNIHDYDPEIYDEDGEEIPRDERPMARAFQTGCEARATVRMRRRDGCLVWLDLRAVPMPGDAHGHQVVVSAVDITERKEAEHALARQATHDPLTGLPNRTLLYDRISQALARRSRLPGDLAVMFLDVDRFKWLNDSLGHAAGDAVLVEVAARLQSAVRDTDTVARFGGDEFVVLCEDMASEEQAMLLARHLSECVSFPIELGATEMTPSVSIGLVIASAVVDAGPDALLRDADAAMYTAKERGRGGRELFDSGTHARTAERHEAERALRRAIDRGELRVHYQPEVDLSTTEVVGVEALVRWAHPERGLIAPNEFVPLAEDTGLIVPLGAAVLREACQQIAAWQHAEPERPPLTLSVNVGARQLLDAGLPEVVRDSLASSGLIPSSLCLEITETAFVEAGESSSGALRELKELGIRIGVDDFGTGYSSLAYLKRFPLDVLKIDRSFVKGLGHNREDRAIVSSIIDIAHAFGLDTVAEGVETLQQLEHLHDLGCERAQGWYWQRPMPADILARWLEGHRATRPSPLLDPGPDRTRTLIVDDDCGLRGMLRCMFDGSEVFELVSEASDGRQAVALARQFQPDLVLLDLAMPGLGGLEALPLILDVAPHATAVVWSNLDARDVEAQALERGATAYLSKGMDPEELISELIVLCDAPAASASPT